MRRCGVEDERAARCLQRIEAEAAPSQHDRRPFDPLEDGE